MKRRVVVTGMEAVTGLGNDLKTTWDGLVEGKSSVRDLSEYLYDWCRSRIGCKPKDWKLSPNILTEKDEEISDIVALYAIDAAVRTWRFHEWETNKCYNYDPYRIGVIIGNGSGGMASARKIHQRMQEARDTGSDHDAGLNNPSGKNPGDIFEINTRPFVKAHFATFPPALPEKILKASCPKQVCKKCKKPRQPISESKQVDIVNCNARGKLRPKSGEDIHLTESMGFSKKYNTINTIIGYTDCGCKAGFEAGTVLDHFFGAGTVGIVAEELSLNWIGIELKKEYADIATERLKPYTTQYKLGEIE